MALSDSEASNQIDAQQEVLPEGASLPYSKNQESTIQTVDPIDTNPSRSPEASSDMLSKSETFPSSGAQSNIHIEIFSKSDQTLVDLATTVPMDIIMKQDTPAPVGSLVKRESDAVTSTDFVAIQITKEPENMNGRIFH